MRTAAIIEGLTILEKYHDRPNGFNTGAEHDILYAYATAQPVATADVERLVELGWWQGEVHIDGDEEYAAKHYEKDEGWECFT